MEVTTNLINKLAALSRLRFEAEAAEEIKKDLEEIIAFVEKLQELDTEKVEPLIHMSSSQNALRQDSVTSKIDNHAPFINAPLHNGKYFMVPKVIRKD